VGFRFQQQLFRDDVLTAIAKDRSINDFVRATATVLARNWPAPEPLEFYLASQSISRDPGAPADRYRFALRCAIEASRCEPTDGDYSRELGYAQFRVGEYGAALETLTRSAPKEGPDSTPDTSYLAFRAMTLFKLGKRDEAQKLFKGIRMQLGTAAIGDVPLVKEAEMLLAGSAPR
jgi:hypothetical protein